MDRLKRHAGKLAAAACALLLLAAGAFWLTGGYDRWSAERLLEDACDGVLPVDEVRAVLGDRQLEEGRPGDHSEGALNDEKTSLRVECTISRQVERNAGKAVRDASVTVTVSGVPTVNRRDRRPELYPSLRSDLPPSPLGQGWNGAFVASDGGDGDAESTTAVLLACAQGRSDLLVTAAVEADDTTLDDPERRADFARIATVTAANASRQWGCDADLGRPLTTAPLSVNKDEHLPLAEAKGTCAGVPGRGKSTARAWESRRGDAPLEECVLGDGQGRQTYVLTASFGPYAEGDRYQYVERRGHSGARADARSGELHTGRWTSAACAGGGEPAFFSVVPYGRDAYEETSAADRAYEQSALKSFAERSAKPTAARRPRRPELGRSAPRLTGVPRTCHVRNVQDARWAAPARSQHQPDPAVRAFAHLGSHRMSQPAQPAQPDQTAQPDQPGQPSQAVNLVDALARFSDLWTQRKIADLNDYEVKVAKLKGEFVWHTHEDTDELFLVISGCLTIQLRDRDVVLGPGELFVVPRGVEHCPLAEEETAILLVEPTGVLNTGDAGGPMTKTAVSLD